MIFVFLALGLLWLGWTLLAIMARFIVVLAWLLLSLLLSPFIKKGETNA